MTTNSLQNDSSTQFVHPQSGDDAYFKKWTKYICVEWRPITVYKIFISLMFALPFFIQINNIWFTFFVSTMVGFTYYLLCENQSQLMTHLWWVCRLRRALCALSIVYIILNHLVIRAQNIVTSKTTFWFSKFKNNVIRILRIRHISVSTALQVQDKFNILSYYDNKMIENKYRKHVFMFNESLRSNDLIIFKDEFGKDITDCIEPYLGPMQNFHGVPLTPKDFCHKKIIVFRDGSINMFKTFEENESIIFKSQ